MSKPSYNLPDLALLTSLETIKVLKALASTNRSLAELKGHTTAILNQGILIDTLALQEAKISSEIENIVTTQNELFQTELFPEGLESHAVKEVIRYRDSLKFGFSKLVQSKWLLPNSTIIGMFQLLKQRHRWLPSNTRNSVKERSDWRTYLYSISFRIPPQDQREINLAMDSLKRFINDDRVSSLDTFIENGPDSSSVRKHTSVSR